ncbi:MAG: CPBP family intramembrane glutamic endopeptidase [Promethearchaeota archaeon]
MESENVNRDLILYFIIAYAFTWLLWLPAVLFTNGLIGGSFMTYFILGMIAPWGPMVSAFSLTLKFEGKSGFKKNIKRWLNFKLGLWWIPVIILVPILVILAHLLNVSLFKGSFPVSDIPLWLIPLIFIITLLIDGPLAEEFGWRGYAKPRMEEKTNSLLANLILGFIWGFWHLPLFFIVGFPHHDFLPLWLFILNAVVFSLIMAWIQNNTEQSIVPALIIHTWMNLMMIFLPLMEPIPGGNYMPWLLSVIIMAVLIAVVTIYYGINFTRKKS